MAKVVISFLLAFLSMTVQGQTYTALWKQAEEAEKKDLPRTQYDVLMKIVNKAQKEGQYGQLMAAELAGSRVMTIIAPDSLQPAVERMEARYRQAKDKALATVYAVVLKKIYADNSQLEQQEELEVTLDYETCNLLAAVKAASYEPLTVKGRDSQWFDDDLLSVVGYQLEEFRALNVYYNKVGNRVASMITALETARQERTQGNVKMTDAPYIQTLDSLIRLYGDLPEAGELAIERFQYMDKHTDATAEEKWAYTEKALGQWGSYKRSNILRNAQKDMTLRQFKADLQNTVYLPERKQKLILKDLRNIDGVTIRIYKADIDGNTDLNPNDEKDFKKLKSRLTELKDLEMSRHYSGHKAYDLFEDTLQFPALPVGVYMLEMASTPATDVSRKLYFVSNVRTMLESLPNKRIRYVVVDAIDGQPCKGATIEVRGYSNGRSNQKIATLTTDGKGEAVYQYDRNRPTSIYAYTKTDKACPPFSSYDNFNYYKDRELTTSTNIFTDRSIYRPGQTVHATAICYEVRKGFEGKALANHQIKLTLRDVNQKVVSEQTLTTDKYGTCATDFTLPSSGLTGYFTITSSSESSYDCHFRVEEYKRPTFEVEFDKVTEDYQDGDTVEVKATARSYAGVPVQDAEVHYRVMRRRSVWWWNYSFYWNRGYIGVEANDETIVEGDAVTASDGTFTVKIPMVLPKTDYPMFYNFHCMADVTDQAGETHVGQISLPLGNRKTALTTDLPEQIRADELSMTKMKLHLCNAAGNDIDATAKYRINDRKWQTVKTNTPIELPKLASGKYTLEAICQDDTLKREFVVFSLDDKRPATETDDWFYVSDYRFPNDGKPITIQVGSSAKDVHIVYSIFSADNVIETGSVDRSGELLNRKLTYKEEYGNGLLLTFAWVKDGKCYRHNASILRPEPDKEMKLKWQTFRDRLTPGQQEEWTLTVMKPDGTPADAQLMATLYDKSLDQIQSHSWYFRPYFSLSLPNTQWLSGSWSVLHLNGYRYEDGLSVPVLDYTHFDTSLFPQRWMSNRMRMVSVRASDKMLARTQSAGLPVPAAAVLEESSIGYTGLDVTTADEALQGRIAGLDIVEKAGNLGSGNSMRLRGAGNLDEEVPDVALRENLNETAFFYPQLQTDANGLVTLKFTLPESLTTWRFMGLAHTPDLCYGTLNGEAVAKKDLMVQPNMPRFLREGDQATISARVINASESDLSGTAYLTFTDPETEKVVYTQKAPFTVNAGETTRVTFNLSPQSADLPLLICKVMATTDEFSDGEQHYLPVLPNRERVTVTYPFTQNEPGTTTIDLTKLVPANVKDAKMTFEYTNNPAWLMIQALPAIGHPNDDCAICQSASFYANSIGKFIIDQVPQAKTVFAQWKLERLRVGDGTSGMQGNETSLQSQLEKNQELKDLVLNETPWVADADNETEQRQRLADFFDENMMQQRLQSALDKLNSLQRGDGSWSWWPDMPGSTYMTISIAEMMVRQNAMMGEQQDTKQMLKGAFKFLGKEMVDLV